MAQRILSLFLASILICSLCCGAFAPDGDKYRAFADKYGPGYKGLDWAQAIEELGGLDAIDWNTPGTVRRFSRPIPTAMTNWTRIETRCCSLHGSPKARPNC